jgi:ribosomal protein L37AE/L43A
MTSQASTPTASYSILSLLVRFVLVLLVGIFAALGFSSLSGREGQLPGMSIAIRLASAAGIGLAAGYFTRILLIGRRPFLQSMVCLAGDLAGLLVLGAMTGWHNGIGPLYFFRSTTDWRGLALLLGAFLCSLIAALAYRKPLGRSQPASSISDSATRRQSRITGGRDKKPATRTADRRATSTAKKTAVQSGKKSPEKSKKKVVKTAQKQTLPKDRKTADTTVIRKRSSKKIVLAPVEEHRCPYCLQPVKRNDPRGVVECDVCHTLHHADCWAITGTCQVPHYNH